MNIRVESLVDQAEKIFQKADGSKKQSIAIELSPGTAQWSAVLRPFIEVAPENAMVITTLLGGAVYAIDRSSTPQGEGNASVSRDADGYSPALRMAWYITKLVNVTAIFESLPEEHQIVTCQHMAIFNQLASDALSLPGIHGLWEQHGLDVEIEIIDLIAEAQGLLAKWLRTSSESQQSFVETLLDRLSIGLEGTSSAAYYNARAYAEISVEMNDQLGHTNHGKHDERLRTLRKPSDVIAAAAFLAGAPDSNGLLRLCNEYLSDLTGLDLPDNHEDGMSL